MAEVIEFPTRDGRVDAPEASSTMIDITTEAFAKRLGNLLVARREGLNLSVGAMARRSEGHFTRRQLRQYESASARVDPVSASALATLYQVDLESILPQRTEIAIDPGGGIISAGGVNASFEPGDPASVLETYLRLVRRLRHQERDEMVSLRREDIEGLAAYLDAPGESIVEQLGALMGATRTQRRLMAGMFLTGAMVITIAVPSVAAFTGGDTARDSGSSSDSSVAVVQVADSDTGEDPGPLLLDGPDSIGDSGRAGTDGDSANVDSANVDGAEGDAAAGFAASGNSPATSPTDSPVTDGQGPQSPGSGEQTEPGPASVGGPEPDVGVGAPPVPPELPPIVEPGLGPVDGGIGSGPGGSGDAGGEAFEPEPVAGPGPSMGGPPVSSGNGGETLEPSPAPLADDGPAPDVEPEFEEPEPGDAEFEDVEESEEVRESEEKPEPGADFEDVEESEQEQEPGAEFEDVEESEEERESEEEQEPGAEFEDVEESEEERESEEEPEPGAEFEDVEESEQEPEPGESDGDKGGKDQGDTDQGDTDQGDTDQGDTDQGDTDQGDTDKGDTGKGDKGKGDKDRGLANANQNANPNAGGLDQANQNANQNANPNR